MVGFFYAQQNKIVHYFQLGKMNDSLLIENTRLRNELAGNEDIDSLQSFVKSIPITRIDTSFTKNADSTKQLIGVPRIVRYAKWEYIPARVINNSIANDRMNFITLDQGSNAGIKPNMPVVGPNGIVGRVARVSKNYSTVLSILSEGRTYSARLADGTAAFISWEAHSANSVNMTKVPLLQKVQRGDSVYTTGYSVFPEGILVGRVAKIDTVKTNNTKTLRLLLSTNFRNLQYVYVAANELGVEKQQLEEQTRQEAIKPAK